MTISAVAARYANALADVVTAPGSPLRAPDALAELRSFDETLRSSPELHNALVTPAVSAGRKRAVVARIGDILKLSRISRNFLYVLIDHRRITALSDVLQTFETVIDERLGFARADVASARPLTDEQRGLLASSLERLTGKRVRARFAVDQSLIGGVIARIGSTVYDGSLRGQLHSLERRLSTEG